MTIELTRCDELEFDNYDFDFKFAGVECFFDGTVIAEFESDTSYWIKSISGTVYVGNSGDPRDECQGTWVPGGQLFDAMAEVLVKRGYIEEEVGEYVRGYYGNDYNPN